MNAVHIFYKGSKHWTFAGEVTVLDFVDRFNIKIKFNRSKCIRWVTATRLTEQSIIDPRVFPKEIQEQLEAHHYKWIAEGIDGEWVPCDHINDLMEYFNISRSMLMRVRECAVYSSKVKRIIEL